MPMVRRRPSTPPRRCPIVVVGDAVRGRSLHDGALSDVAPTLCELMGIPVGPEMTGHSLLDPVAAVAD